MGCQGQGQGGVRVASKEKAEARENQRIRCCTVGRTHSDLPHLVTGCLTRVCPGPDGRRCGRDEAAFSRGHPQDMGRYTAVIRLARRHPMNRMSLSRAHFLRLPDVSLSRGSPVCTGFSVKGPVPLPPGARP